jgi:hypothetical protein
VYRSGCAAAPLCFNMFSSLLILLCCLVRTVPAELAVRAFCLCLISWRGCSAMCCSLTLAKQLIFACIHVKCSTSHAWLLHSASSQHVQELFPRLCTFTSSLHVLRCRCSIHGLISFLCRMLDSSTLVRRKSLTTLLMLAPVTQSVTPALS